MIYVWLSAACWRTVLDGDDLMAIGLEDVSDQSPVGRLIIGDQHPPAHRATLSPFRAYPTTCPCQTKRGL